MYFRGPHGRLALPNESPSLNKANLLTYFKTANNIYVVVQIGI